MKTCIKILTAAVMIFSFSVAFAQNKTVEQLDSIINVQSKDIKALNRKVSSLEKKLDKAIELLEVQNRLTGRTYENSKIIVSSLPEYDDDADLLALDAKAERDGAAKYVITGEENINNFLGFSQRLGSNGGVIKSNPFENYYNNPIFGVVKKVTVYVYYDYSEKQYHYKTRNFRVVIESDKHIKIVDLWNYEHRLLLNYGGNCVRKEVYHKTDNPNDKDIRFAR
ncbi:hypothetical protein Dip518_001010 [Parelusimicrobium proximum]|uniref:hypothetical protein n=1 Tax=Parelusimicrobium proximum TaxID=3228953 RepID=UPI003D16D9D7